MVIGMITASYECSWHHGKMNGRVVRIIKKYLEAELKIVRLPTHV